jgi:hypothetical protein
MKWKVNDHEFFPVRENIPQKFHKNLSPSIYNNFVCNFANSCNKIQILFLQSFVEFGSVFVENEIFFPTLYCSIPPKPGGSDLYFGHC